MITKTFRVQKLYKPHTDARISTESDNIIIINYMKMCVPPLFKQVPFENKTTLAVTACDYHQVIDWSQRSLVLYMTCTLYMYMHLVCTSVLLEIINYSDKKLLSLRM